MKIQFVKLSENASVPVKKSRDDAGYDLKSAIDYSLYPGEIRIIPTDISIALAKGTFGMVVSRSGLASKGIVVNNAPGIIDCNYRGNCGVILRNQTDDIFNISKGDRIAQLLVMPYFNVDWDEVPELDETSRGTGGFGSSGI